MAEKFKFKKEELSKTLKVFGWSVGSAVVVLLLGLVSALDVPAEYLWAVPAVNTVLYALKEFLSDRVA